MSYYCSALNDLSRNYQASGCRDERATMLYVVFYRIPIWLRLNLKYCQISKSIFYIFFSLVIVNFLNWKGMQIIFLASDRLLFHLASMAENIEVYVKSLPNRPRDGH